MEHHIKIKTKIRNILNGLLDYKDVSPHVLSEVILNTVSSITSVLSNSTILPNPKFTKGDIVICHIFKNVQDGFPEYRKFKGVILDVFKYDFFSKMYEYAVEITSEDILDFLNDKYPILYESELEKVEK